MELLKTIFFAGLYIAGILFALSIIFATIGVWVDKIKAPKRKEQAKKDVIEILDKIQKVAETTEKPKKTAKRASKKEEK